MRLSDGMELDLNVTVTNLENQVGRAEYDFFEGMDVTFKQAANDIEKLGRVIESELTLPLKNQYAETAGAPEKLFLDYIDSETRRFNALISSAKTWFLSSWGQTYGLQDFLNRYGKYFDRMLIGSSAVPVRRGISGQLHGGYQGSSLAGLGILIIPIVAAAAKSAVISKAWEMIITKFMEIEIVQQTVANIIRTLIELYQAVYYIIRPDVKDRANRVERRARLLEQTAGNMEHGINNIVTAIQSYQDNVARRIDIYVAQLERIANPPAAEAPYVAPVTTGGQKFTYQDPAARGIKARYNIKGTPVITTTGSSQKITYEREYLADGDAEHQVSIPALQYAARIYIHKERFPVL